MQKIITKLENAFFSEKADRISKWLSCAACIATAVLVTLGLLAFNQG